MTTTTDPINILLVEDSPGDVELVQHGLRRSKLSNNLHVVSDGVKAMEYMERVCADPDGQRPDLVLLDINLPRMSGHEVLDRMRKNEQLSSVPVVILTTSGHDNDVTNAYNHQANAYVQKPLDAVDFLNVVQSIDEFWLSIVKLPPR